MISQKLVPWQHAPLATKPGECQNPKAHNHHDSVSIKPQMPTSSANALLPSSWRRAPSSCSPLWLFGFVGQQYKSGLHRRLHTHQTLSQCRMAWAAAEREELFSRTTCICMTSQWTLAHVAACQNGNRTLRGFQRAPNLRRAQQTGKCQGQ